MKYVKQLFAFAVAITIIIGVIIVYNLPTTKETSFVYEFMDTDTKLVTLTENQEFNGIEVLDWQYEKKYEPDPRYPAFYTQEKEYKPDSQISVISFLEQPYEFEILKVRNTNKIRLHVPKTFYKTEDTKTYEYTTTYLKIKLKITETFNPLFSVKADYEPEGLYGYVIITNDSFWQIFNTYYKDWKIASDSKVDSIWIVNVSYITSGIGCHVNGTYGDAMNESMGNAWIPDGKEIQSDWELFNDTQAQIRNFIRMCVSTYNTEYVLLGGNKNIVQPRMVCSNASGNGCGSFDSDTSHASDMYYACLHYCMNNNTNSYWMENECCGYSYDEVDWGFDLCVGRVLAGATSELYSWINKTKAYVDGNSQGDYLSRHLNACKDNGNSISNQTWTGWWADMGVFGPGIGDEFPSNFTFVNNQNISQVQWEIMDDYVNGDVVGWDGINIIYHAGHGGTLYNTNGGCYNPFNCFNYLTPNFVYTEGCHSADFGTDTTSRMENWIVYNTTYAGIANSAYGWFVASTYFGEEMMSRMFNETRGINEMTFCQAHNDARETEGHTVADGVFAMIYKETNFFGDPALDWIWYQPGYSPQTEGPIFISIEGENNGTNIVVSNPTFNWTIIANTSQYNLQIATDNTFASLVVNITNISEVLYPVYYSQNETNVSFTLPPPYVLVTYNVYYCRVRAHTK